MPGVSGRFDRLGDVACSRKMGGFRQGPDSPGHQTSFLTAIPDASVGENSETHLPLPNQPMVAAVAPNLPAVTDPPPNAAPNAQIQPGFQHQAVSIQRTAIDPRGIQVGPGVTAQHPQSLLRCL